MYPRKGALAVGSDPDIVVLGTSMQKTIRAAVLHETDYTPWGRARRDGLAQRDGQFLPRKVADEIHGLLFERVLSMPKDVAYHTSDLHFLAIAGSEYRHGTTTLPADPRVKLGDEP